MFKHFWGTVFCLPILVLSSCDKKPTSDVDIVIIPTVGSVMIANEGNFQFGNASLTVFDIGGNVLNDNVFEKVNGRSLGDVCQSINVINNKAYLVVNNSAKIEVVNPQNFQSLVTITGFKSPRYIIQIDANRAYVSEYYSNKLCVVDLNSNQIIDSIAMDGWGEEMLLFNNKVYVTNPRKKQVYIINTSSNDIEDSIAVVYGGCSIQLDAQQQIWVLSKGDVVSGILPALQRINTQIDSVDKQFVLSFAEAEVSRLRMNADRTILYWLGKHVYRHVIADASVSSLPFIRAIGQNFYGLGVNPKTNELYVSDAKDFVQRSTINRFRLDGSLIGDFKAGIIAADFYFYYP